MALVRCLQSVLLVSIVFLVALAAVACGSDPTPTPTPTPEPTQTPTPTPRPTPTHTPEPTATPVPAPAPGSSRDSLVPDGATLVVDANLSEILDSPVMQPMIKLLFGGAESEGGVLEDFQNKTGISLASVDRAEVFLDLGSLSALGQDPDSVEGAGLPTLGVALRGGVDEEEFLAKLRMATSDDSNLQYDAVDYRGYTMYADANRKPENFSYAFADEDMLVFGSIDGVEAMLDVAAGAAAPMSGSGVAALEALGDRDIGVIMVTSADAMEAFTSEGADNLGLMGLISASGVNAPLSVTKILLDGDSMRIRSVQFFDNETDAAAYKEYNEGTMALLGAMSGSAEIQSLVADAEIKQDGAEVSLDVTVDADSLTAILDFLSLMTQAGAP